jgi:hypothetical protein
MTISSNQLAYWDVDATLLSGETDGLAVDFTGTTYSNSATWLMKDVQERNGRIDTLQSPHTFFTQSGTSPKYVKGSATTLAWSPHNLLLNSENLGSTDWAANNSSVAVNDTTAPDGAATADKITASSGSANHEVFTDEINGNVASVLYTASAYLKAGTHQYASLCLNSWDNSNEWAATTVDLSGGTITQETAGAGATHVDATITSMGSGWYRVSTTASDIEGVGIYLTIIIPNNGTPTHGNFAAVTWNAAGTETIFAWGAQVNRGYEPTAYIATTTAAKIGLPISYGEGLLVEPAATNLLVQSQTLDVTWTSPGCAVSANAVTAPDGTTTADTITMDSGGPAEHGLASAIMTTVASSIYTTSAYLKAGTSSLAILVRGGNTDGTHWVAACADLSNGTITQTSNGVSASNVSSAITSVGNGWYRVSITGSFGNTDPSVVIYGTDDSTPSFGSFGAHTWTAAGTETIHAWGVQTELGTVATSYIPTVAATATRAVDVITAATSTFPWSDANLTIDFEYMPLRTGTGNTEIISVYGAGGEIHTIYQQIGVNPLGYQIDDGGATQATVNAPGTNISVNNIYKAALSTALNDVAIVIDGGSVGTDTSATMPTVTTLGLGKGAFSFADPFLLRLFRTMPRTASDAELQAMTT